MCRDGKKLEYGGGGLHFLWVAPLILFGVFSLGYCLAGLLFRFIGLPRDFTTFLIRLSTGFLLFLLVSMLFSGISKFIGGYPFSIRQELLKTLERLSQGDFDVFIKDERHNPYSDIVDSVNHMAKELGNMEQHRQEFISNVSHEIQSPLTSIGGFAALLKDDRLSAEDKEKYLNIIETESARLSRLSDNLLRLSELETDEKLSSLSDYRLDKQIEGAVLMLEPHYAQKDILFSLDLEEAVIEGDEELLNQVWINLIHNALKFSKEKGEIRIALFADEANIICEIQDFGCGIPKEDIVHIFERFYKADKARDRALGGNGLGLALVKKIVALHGGNVWAESEPGEGASFIVRIPVRSAAREG
ncbi:MAG: HAMP domain-containing histidine kinase [Clostridiales Family XIII bacterium]|jgi:signal transduction histidine kinase|nr:HAMP domain-containing histidine kinase [Clostridiales Family XIII bacterium]